MPTKIEWTDITINPLVGCTKTSEGCKNCYAEKMAYRLKCIGIPKYQDVVDKNGWTGEIAGDLSQFFSLPKKSKRVFVCSMGDLFHENVRDCSINMVFNAMAGSPQHTYILLTKRLKRMKYFLEHRISHDCMIPNVWLGCTAEDQQQADKRIPILLQIPAAVRFVSIEPMLSEINISEWLYAYGSSGSDETDFWEDGIDWVICGTESGPNRRPAKIEWIRDLKNQCVSAGVPFFLKQMEIDGKVVKMPELDGRTWDEYPKWKGNS